ncbi:ubiquinone biosynthesis O-methyltransferase-like [Haematobia irritans]|uniref:ubiquinone biosynthesis O-methyltransferase-like n=1 Tax=Haematobia irritans TaxID=7368 RepID=UPI003F4F62EB
MSGRLQKSITLVLLNHCSVRTISTTRRLQTKSVQPKLNLSDQTKSEIIHHSKLGIHWWNPHGPVKALHSLNKLRVPFVYEGLITQGKISSDLINTSKVLKNQQILEVGCGGGILTEDLARHGATVTALDLSEDLIILARNHLASKENVEICDRVHYKVEPIEQHVKKNNCCYDAVVISEVLEHVDDKIGFLKASVAAIKPGGSIFITTLSKTISMWIYGVLIAEYVLQAIPIGTHHYDKMIRPADVENILKTMDCDTVLVKGSIYDFFTNNWRWINSTNLFYALHAVKK